MPFCSVSIIDYFPPFSKVFVVEFEQVHVSWVIDNMEMKNHTQQTKDEFLLHMEQVELTNDSIQ